MRKLLLLILLSQSCGCVDNKKVTQILGSVFPNKLYNKELILTVNRVIGENKSTIPWKIKTNEHLEIHSQQSQYALQTLFQLSDTLVFKHYNDKCGEWGGDQEIIKIYLIKNVENGVNEEVLYAFYQMNEYSCDSLDVNPYGTIPKVYMSQPKKLSQVQAKIAEECIFDLLKHKLSNDNLIYHAGISNTVELKGSIAFVKDPSLFIDDYPSFQWEKFHILKNELTK